jgi:hypothetical protein
VCKRAATCADPYPAECSDTNTCHAGCACPPERHLFEDGRCITIEQCPQQSTSPFCGRSGAFPHQAAARPATRIFGGRDAARGEWPWAVQLLRNRCNLRENDLLEKYFSEILSVEQRSSVLTGYYRPRTAFSIRYNYKFFIFHKLSIFHKF